jgi:anti-sigma B factor antagonist
MMTTLGEQDGAATEVGPAGGRGLAVPPVGANGSVPDFSLSLERPDDGTAVLVLAGELDLYCAPEIEAAFAAAIGADSGDRDEEPHLLVVDLRSVTFVDSTMLGLLLTASRREQARGAELRILVGPETPMTAFVVTGVDRLLAISLVDNGSNPSAAYLATPEHASNGGVSTEP